ncbi:FAD binding domain-containing protein [Arthrobacter terrae]|uniref:FAD binding domain-containing protein n=1 Tax=Arthrobacter terrae TaxID=2935737 RepID=UPI001E5D03B5|nr:FAD binding domain-containing protein [Arthrobacter terrae]
MIPFDYRRAEDADAAVAMVSGHEGTAYLAGGTNLVDHMRSRHGLFGAGGVHAVARNFGRF